MSPDGRSYYAAYPAGYCAMSNQALTWAQTVTVGSSTRKAVLMVLADYADHEWSCFPSQATIARITELSVRAVRAALAKLEEDGWLRRTEQRRGDGGRTTDRIYLRRPPRVVEPLGPPPTKVPPGTEPPAPPAPAAAAPPAPRAGQYPPVVDPPSDPVVTHREQLALMPNAQPPAALPEQHRAVGQVLGSDRDLAFREFWESYPRKAGKGAARLAWAKARRRGVLPEVLVAGARRFAADPNRTDQFTPHPATWLNQERWEDEPLPARGPSTAMGRTASGFAAMAAAVSASSAPAAIGTAPLEVP